MKVFLKDQNALFVQKRDVQYLADLGLEPFIDSPFLKDGINESTFVKLEGKEMVDYFQTRDDIIDYFDYLQMDIASLRQQTDIAEDDYSTTLAMYRNLVKKKKDTMHQYSQMVKKQYRFTSLLEMMQDKQSGGMLLEIPFGYAKDENSYFYQTDHFFSTATEVEGIYMITSKDGKQLTLTDNNLRDYFKKALYMLASASKTQEKFKENYTMQSFTKLKDNKIYVAIRPIAQEKVYKK